MQNAQVCMACGWGELHTYKVGEPRSGRNEVEFASEQAFAKGSRDGWMDVCMDG